MSARKEAPLTDTDLAQAKRFFPRGSTVFTILRHVARSGMQRHISVVAFIDGDAKHPVHPNYLVAQLIGARVKRGGMHDALVRNGCGYDAGHDIVYALALKLYGDGEALSHESL
jgi:hypothetical protein